MDVLKGIVFNSSPPGHVGLTLRITSGADNRVRRLVHAKLGFVPCDYSSGSTTTTAPPRTFGRGLRGTHFL